MTLADQATREDLLEAVIGASLDCVIVIDEPGRVVEFNPAAERTFGYARADALGRSIGELIVPDATAKPTLPALPGWSRAASRGCSAAASRSRRCAPTAASSRSS